MKKIMISFLTMCIPALILAQLPGQIKGKVFDSTSKKTLTGVTVYADIMGKKIPTLSDSAGNFTIKPLNAGTYTVYFTYFGYDTVQINSVTVYPDKITFLDNVYLSGCIELAGYEVKVYKNKLIDPEAPTKIPIINEQRKEMAESRDINKVIEILIPGVTVSDNGDEIYFRGSRNGDAVYFVDGVKMMDNQIHIPGIAIGSMTVYTGGVPANYGDFTGGVVVIETQSYFSWLNEHRKR